MLESPSKVEFTTASNARAGGVPPPPDLEPLPSKLDIPDRVKPKLVELPAQEADIPKEMECLDIVGQDDRWHIAVQVRRVSWVTVRWANTNGRNKMSTPCKGGHIQVRWGTCVGKTAAEVKWPAAVSEKGQRL